ncbi:MAG: AI-2E family transporter [Chloroflexi bacterium]|nr:MAG: AI-2E family transporter [Chloroflexota bacterium]
MRNVRPNPQPGAPHERELESPAPISGVTASAWSLDPKRRRRYLQIAFGIAALIVAIVVLFLLRDFLGAFVLGSAIAFLIQPAVARLHAAGVPRILAIVLVFIAIIIVLAGLVLLIVPLGVSEVNQLQVQLPNLTASAQDRLNSLQPIRVFGIDIDLKGACSYCSCSSSRSFLRSKHLLFAATFAVSYRTITARTSTRSGARSARCSTPMCGANSSSPASSGCALASRAGRSGCRIQSRLD